MDQKSFIRLWLEGVVRQWLANPVWNPANMITMFGFICIGLAGFLTVYMRLPQAPVWAFAAVCIAALSDWADGVVARKLSCKTTLGEDMDPLRDKVMLLLIICFQPLLGMIIVIIEAVGRELSVFLRGKMKSYFIARGSKSITAIQLASVLCIFGNAAFFSADESFMQGASGIVLLGSLYRFKIYFSAYRKYFKETRISCERFVTVPNIITVAGAFLLVPAVHYYLAGDLVLAIVYYAGACLSDLLDGIMARLLGQETEFGKRLDPIRDKMIIAVPLALFAPYALLLLAVPEAISAYFSLKAQTLSKQIVITNASKLITGGQFVLLPLYFFGLETGYLAAITAALTILSISRALTYRSLYRANTKIYRRSRLPLQEAV